MNPVFLPLCCNFASFVQRNADSFSFHRSPWDYQGGVLPWSSQRAAQYQDGVPFTILKSIKVFVCIKNCSFQLKRKFFNQVNLRSIKRIGFSVLHAGLFVLWTKNCQQFGMALCLFCMTSSIFCNMSVSFELAFLSIPSGSGNHAQSIQENWTKVESRFFGVRYKKVITHSANIITSYTAEESKCTTIVKKQLYWKSTFTKITRWGKLVIYHKDIGCKSVAGWQYIDAVTMSGFAAGY